MDRDNPPIHNRLELQVSDFGPIIDAKVDLRPLTVFVGPSNTGKSYLAILIYALHKFFGTRDSLYGPGLLWRRSRVRYRKPKDFTEEFAHDFASWMNEKYATRRKARQNAREIIPDSIANFIRSNISNSTDSRDEGNRLSEEICRCFGIEKINALIREGSRRQMNIKFRRGASADFRPFEHELKINPEGPVLTRKIPEETPLRIEIDDNMWIDEISYMVDYMISSSKSGRRQSKREASPLDSLVEIISDMALRYIISPLGSPAFYLPADRTGVMHAHSAVVSALIARAPLAALRPTTAGSVISGVLADFLEQLIELDVPGSWRGGSSSDLGKGIEDLVLGGSVRANRSKVTGHPFFTYQPKGWKKDIPLMNASSMVSELAPVVLYLRHMVQPGDVLIVEEPESHLHPSMQIRFTQHIASIVKSGIQVIVTTHSEWLLEKLANLVQLSRAPKMKQNDTSGQNVPLSPDHVGVWLFQPRHRLEGSYVREIRLEATGLYPSGFSRVAAVLHNEWANISSEAGRPE